jgi:hypothetical protein
MTDLIAAIETISSAMRARYEQVATTTAQLEGHPAGALVVKDCKALRAREAIESIVPISSDEFVDRFGTNPVGVLEVRSL